MADSQTKDPYESLFVKRSPSFVLPASAQPKDFKGIRRNISSKNRPVSAKNRD